MATTKIWKFKTSWSYYKIQINPILLDINTLKNIKERLEEYKEIELHKQLEEQQKELEISKKWKKQVK